MIIDANHLQEKDRVSTDICIVGGGVAGLTLAKELLNSGREVCVLEQGGMSDEDEIQKALRGRVVGYPYWGLDFARHAQVGGTSHRWFLGLADGGMGGRFRPLDPIDFEEREEIPHSGWPFTRRQLDPYYERAQRLLRLGPYEYAVEEWASRDETVLGKADPLQTVIFQFGGREPFAEEYPDELAASETTTILYHSHVRSLSTYESGRAVSTADVVTPNGSEFRVEANVFVLALGGIENARLLLLSKDQCPDGLGNEHDLVGRYFMEHPHFMSGLFWPSDPSLFDQDDLYFTNLRRNTTIQGKLALREDVLRREQLRNFCISLWPTADPYDKVYRSPAYDAVRMFKSTLRNGYLPDRPLRRGWTILRHGRRLVRHLASRVARKVRQAVDAPNSAVAYRLHHFSEQAPNPRSRVRLADDKLDPFGQPCAELDLQFTDDDIRDVLRGQEIIKEEVERKGLGRIEMEDYDQVPPPGIKGGFHHMGTTRMHSSPRQGVVDANSRVHSVENLYVTGSSVFPTSGYANPTLTICALAVRLADHLTSIDQAGAFERVRGEEETTA